MHIFTATNSTRRCGFLHTSLLLALGLCQEKHYFICEKQRAGYLPNSSTITLNSNPTQEITCPHGWYKHNNNCYKVRNWRYWCDEHYIISWSDYYCKKCSQNNWCKTFSNLWWYFPGSMMKHKIADNQSSFINLIVGPFVKQSPNLLN